MSNHNPGQRVFQQKTCQCIYDAQILPDFSPAMFDIEYWSGIAEVRETCGGRGSSWHIHNKTGNFVLRHYRRGGVVSALSKDKYFMSFFCASRAEREHKILLRANAEGLPVPRPVGVRVQRHGMVCSMDILLGEIPNSVTLAEKICQSKLPSVLWHEVGSVIKRFQNSGYAHADLNAHNILIDDCNKVWLIDFDKSRRILWRNGWKKRNLQRLKRSLEKIQCQSKKTYWSDEDWQYLLTGHEK